MKTILKILMSGIGLMSYLYPQINLIKNPSFEEHDCVPDHLPYTSPDTLSFDCCRDWIVIVPTPDYYSNFSPLYNPPCYSTSSIKKSSASIPRNSIGNQYPKDGNFYIGMYLFADTNYMLSPSYSLYSSEMIEGFLNDTLIKNNLYEFTGYISKAESCPISLDKFEVYFTNFKFPYTFNSSIYLTFMDTVLKYFPTNYRSKISFKDTMQKMQDTTNWIKISGCFKAMGGERYIYLGRFTHPKLTPYYYVGYDTSYTCISLTTGEIIEVCTFKSNYYYYYYPLSYYFIDDLSLYDRGYYGEDARARSDTLVCPNTPILLGNNDTSQAHYQWFPPTFLNCDTCSNPLASPTITTTYVVKKFLCNYATYDTVTIYVAPTPTPVSIIKDTTLCYPAQLLLATSDTNNIFTQYQWTPPDYLSCANCPYPTFNPPDTGTYHYFFIQTFCNTKLTQDSLNIQVKQCGENAELEIPNVFTPNNDNSNDEWFIHWKYDKNISNFNVEIYNRWGAKVFFSEDKNFKWNGKCLPDADYIHLPDEQNNCPTGTYFYIIQYQINKEKREWKGTITLLR